MRVQSWPKYPKLAAIYVVAAVSMVSHSFAAGPPVLSQPTWTGDQFRFVLAGESNVSYVVESSTNLRTWTVVLTNHDWQATQIISLPASGSLGFWRVASPLFMYAIAARGPVSLTNGNVMIDSFDSSDPNFSSKGQYDPTKRKAGGDVASNTTNVNVGDAKIAGVLHTGPGGTVTIGPNGSVGDLAWLSNPVHAGQIQPGYLRQDMNLSFATVSAPFHSAPSPGPGPDWILNSGDYKIVNFTINAGRRMTITGRVRFHVVDTLYVEGSIEILAGAHLDLYVGRQFYVQGHGRINHTGTAERFNYYGLNENREVYLQDNAYIVGTMYAPQADFDMSATAGRD